ncbi:MAG TPA: multidrug effflux MFS transporter [Gammaproteobacteria bacterium]
MSTSPSPGHVTPPKGLILVIGLVSMIGPFSIDTYLPSFPAIAQGLGVGLPALAQTLSIYLVAFAAATLVWGPLSDRFGRRPTLLVSLSLFIVASIGCALAESYATLMMWRACQGAFACGGMVIGRAVVRDVYAGAMAQRAMSHVMLVFAAAPALAPVIGGWLESLFGWRSVFLFLALFGLFAVVLVFRGLPETHPQAARHSIHPRSVGTNYLRVLRHGRFLALVAALSLGFGGLFLYISGSPALIYDHLGLGEGDFGWFVIPAVAGMMAGSWLSGRIAHSWSPLNILKLGFAVLGVAFIANLLDALWSTPGLFSVVAPLVLYAFGVTLVIPVLTVQALDCFPHNRGMASAVQSFAQMSFNAVVAGFLMPLTASSLVYMALAQGLLLCASVLIMWKTSVRPHVH